MYLVAGHDVAEALFALDGQFGEVDVELQAAQARFRLEGHLDHLRLAVGVGREPGDTASGGATGEVVFLVAGHTRNLEAFHIVGAAPSILVDDVVDHTVILLVEQADMLHILADEELVGHADNLIAAIVVEDDYLVEDRAVEQVFILFERHADEALVAVEIELLVGLGHARCLDVVESADYGAARERRSIFLLEGEEPVDSVVGQVVEMPLDFSDALVVEGDDAVGLLGREFQDALHLYLHQAQHIVVGHLPDKLGEEGEQAFVDMGHDSFHRLPLLELLVLVDAFLDEDTFERREIELFADLAELDFKLAAKQVAGALGAVAQQVADGEEHRLAVADDTAVGGDGDLAVGEGIEGVYGFVGGGAALEMHQDTRLVGGVVVDLAYLDFPLLVSLEDRLDDGAGGLAVWYLGDGEGHIVDFLDFGPDAHTAATFAVIVTGDIDETPGGEVGQEGELAPLEVCYGRVENLVEVVGQNLG